MPVDLTSQNAAETIQASIYRSMAPAEKWREVCRLGEMARALKTAAVRAQHPDWSDEEIRRAVSRMFLYATT